jgi:hypothetical protein
VNLYTELILRSKININETISLVQHQFKTMLTGENFKSTINYSHLISLMAFFCIAYYYTNDKTYINWMVENDNIMTYISTSKGFVNTQGYLKKNLSLYDVKYHLKVIQTLIIYHYE